MIQWIGLRFNNKKKPYRYCTGEVFTYNWGGLTSKAMSAKLFPTELWKKKIYILHYLTWGLSFTLFSAVFNGTKEQYLSRVWTQIVWHKTQISFLSHCCRPVLNNNNMMTYTMVTALQPAMFCPASVFSFLLQ